MTRLGALLAFLGFGSVLLHYLSTRELTLMAWATPWQPFVGLGVGALGAVFLVIPMLMNKDQPAEGAPQGYAPPPPGAPAGYGPPPASPPGGFAQPQYAPPGSGPGYGPGYGQPNPGYPQQGQPPIPPQGPQYGQRPPQGPPPQRGPGNFGPQDGPPFGPQGR
jgi:hypothetical protein